MNEHDLQDAGEEDIMFKPLLDDINVEMLMDEDDFEIDRGSRDGLQGIEQGGHALINEGKLEA